ncbi:class I SAM-dependent methyltransferase [Bradyrhizobium elkanii]|uniref:class I SAM-dependent methyltransferase n=1 Tax=Bradyrhizobium elkanii TaxID=29448 RepID=UPI003D9BE33C
MRRAAEAASREVPNLSFVAGAAEDLPFPDGSLALVTAATAAHWFDRPLDNLQQIWVPSTAFVIDTAGLLYPRYGVRRVGYLRHLFDGDRHTHEYVEPDRFIGINLGNWMRAPGGFHARYAKEPWRGLVLEDREAALAFPHLDSERPR